MHTTQVSDAILNRVCGEFLEMPGLQLTRQQAQRLWGLDEASCTRVLDHLVAARFLARGSRGTYMRAGQERARLSDD